MSWQPIETAPRGTYGEIEHLLYDSRTKRFAVGYFDHEEGEWMTDYRGKGNAQWVHPTHWMPLPPPPEGGQDE